jgi:anti-sigma B factor antagonist
MTGDGQGSDMDGKRAKLSVHLDERDGIPVARASGEIDVATAQGLRSELATVPSGTRRLVVDLSDVTFLDSTGLGVLIATLKRLQDAEDESSVALVVTRPQIVRVLEVTGLTGVFSVHASIEDALAP